MTYRILLDQDSVVYDLSTVWYAQHNKDYPNHKLCIEHWDTAAVCKSVGCEADVYSYFNNPETWTDGTVLGYSDVITRLWQQDYPDIELAFVTTASNNMSTVHKGEWLDKYFPHIKPRFIVNAHIKHWINGDILIDDGIHNVEHFRGIRILYDQARNRNTDEYIRAVGNTDEDKWKEVDRIVRKAIKLLDDGLNHNIIELVLRHEQRIGL